MLGVDRHGQAQFLSDKAYLTVVNGISDTGDGIAAAGLFRHQAAEQVDLVRVCDGDQKIGLLDAGVLLHGIAGAVALNAQHVKIVRDVGNDTAFGVDYGNVMSLRDQLLYQSAAYLAASYNNNLHTSSPFAVKFQTSGPHR